MRSMIAVKMGNNIAKHARWEYTMTEMTYTECKQHRLISDSPPSHKLEVGLVRRTLVVLLVILIVLIVLV